MVQIVLLVKLILILKKRNSLTFTINLVDGNNWRYFFKKNAKGILLNIALPKPF